MRSVYVLLSIAGILPSAFWGQANVRQQLHQAFAFQEQGHFDKVIALVPALIQSGSLAPREEGQTWTVLAFAYEEEGDLSRAQDSYEQALRVLKGDEQFAKDYAIALENFANLYRETGRLDDAVPLATKAFHLFQRLNSHDGIARSCASLASFELARKKLRKSEQYLVMAARQAAVADGLDEDYYADLSATQAWHAALSGDANAALSGYRHSLDLWRHKHGEEHMITGWGYILLGQADAQAGNKQTALDNMRRGLAILNHVLGPHNPKYLLGEIAYSQTLEATGARNEAIAIRIKAKMELAAFYHAQCADCRINVTALR